MRRPLVSTSAALLLLLTACAGDGSDGDDHRATATEAAGPAASRPDTTAAAADPLPAPVSLTEEEGGVRRFGEGRALLASYDPGHDRTVVATTIGLAVQTGDDEPVVLTRSRPTMLSTSADGRLAAITTSSGELQMWDVVSGERVATFAVGPDRFSSLTFAGEAVVAASETEAVRFHADGHEEPLVDAPQDGTLGPVAVDGSGGLAVPVQSGRPVVAVWSADGAPSELDVGLPEGTRLTGVTWSGDGRQLAVLYALPQSGDTVGIWDVTGGRFTAQIPLPNFVLPHQVAFPTLDRLVLPNLDRVVAYDLTGHELAAFPTGDSAVSAVSPAGGAAVVSRLDGTLTRWSIDEAPAELAPRTVALVDQRGGEAVTVVDQVGLVRTFDADGAARRRLDRWAVGEATAVDLGADGALVVATSTGAVRVLDGATVTAVLDRPQGRVSDVSIAPDDGRVATGVSVQKRSEAWDDTIEVTDLGAQAPAFTLGGEAEDVTGCAFYEANVVFSPDGTLLASTSHDFTVQVSPVAEPDATVVLEPHLGSVLDVEFSPDGGTLLTSADDGTMRVWAVDGWRLEAELPAAPGGWFAMAYSPDGSTLAVSDVYGRIAIVDQTSGAVERELAGTRAVLGDMVFTPDGRSLVAPLPDGAVGVWDVATGTVAHQLRGHTLPVNGLTVSADGATLVTASQDGTVRSWPLPTT